MVEKGVDFLRKKKNNLRKLFFVFAFLIFVAVLIYFLSSYVKNSVQDLSEEIDVSIADVKMNQSRMEVTLANSFNDSPESLILASLQGYIFRIETANSVEELSVSADNPNQTVFVVDISGLEGLEMKKISVTPIFKLALGKKVRSTKRTEYDVDSFNSSDVSLATKNEVVENRNVFGMPKSSGGGSSGGGSGNGGGTAESSPSCSDGIQNGDETGIDCGGSCSACDCLGVSNQSCNITNGIGIQLRNCYSNGTWSDWGTCSVFTCNTNYTLNGSVCSQTSQSNQSNQSGCAGAINQSCLILNGIGIQTRECINNLTWSSWSSCSAVSCNPNYYKSGNLCLLQQSCTGSSTQSCSITNGVGSQSRTCSSGVWSDWGTCSVASCNSGYIQSGNGCVSQSTYSGMVYYVSNSGSDSNSGTSEASPWKTISKVNSKTFSPGDAVLFKRGDVWREAIEVDNNGAPGQYITFGAYGTGAKPKILGSTAISDWVSTGTPNIWKSSSTLSNPWTVITASGTNSQVFYIENDGSVTWGYYEDYDASFSQLSDEYDWTWDSNYLYIYSPSNPNSAYDSVEAPQRQYAAKINYVNYIAFDDIEMAYLGGYGIRDAYGPRTLYGLRVTNMHIHHIGRKGSNVAYGTYNYHSDAYYAYNDIHDCGRRSISVAAVSYSTSATVDGVIIEHNYFHDGYHTTGVDITPSGSSAAPHIITNIYIRNNFFEGDPDILLRGGDRSDLYYDDGLNSNHIYISNENGGYLGEMSNINIYNNIFTYATGKAITLAVPKNASIFYNTFYGVNPTLINTQGFVYITEGSITPTDVDIRNNIFYNDAPYKGDIWYPCIKADANWKEEISPDYNLYYSPTANLVLIWIRTRYNPTVQGGDYTISDWVNYKSQTGWDTHSPTPAIPLFADAANNDFSLTSGSSAIGAGTPISWITTDYYGNPRDPATPTIGAVEY